MYALKKLDRVHVWCIHDIALTKVYMCDNVAYKESSWSWVKPHELRTYTCIKIIQLDR